MPVHSAPAAAALARYVSARTAANREVWLEEAAKLRSEERLISAVFVSISAANAVLIVLVCWKWRGKEAKE
jgi:hypothetical protein